MKVYPVFFRRVSGSTFKSRVVYTEPVNAFSQSEKDCIDRFEEGDRTGMSYLGEGVTSTAYYSPLYNFVIKQNKVNPYIKEKDRSDNGSLAYEARMLFHIGDDVKTTQRVIGYAETENGGKFLISKFVQGKPNDLTSNPFQPKHIDRLLRNLNRLDRSQIIHSDLSRPNLLLTENFDVNIIDYQWAEKFTYSPYSENHGIDNAYFPDFEAPNNALMFESASLSGYLRRMPKNQVKDFVKSYLQIKSKYTKKKIDDLEKLSVENPYIKQSGMIDFEKAKYQAYLNPTDDVIKTEILKFNILNLNRRQYSCHDENKIQPRNILRTIPLCFEAKDCADELTYFKPQNDSGNSKYYEYMNKYGKYWQDIMQVWYPKTFDWIYKVVSGYEQDTAKRYFPDKLNDFSNLTIVSEQQNNLNDVSSDNIETKSKEEEKEMREEFLSAARNGFNYYDFINTSNKFNNFFRSK